MHSLSDKDIDRLGRKAAEQYDVEQNTSGWEKLEQKLDIHLPETGKKERRRFLFFIWLFALLSGGGLLWMLTGNHDSEMIALQEKFPEETQPIIKNQQSDRSVSAEKPKNYAGHQTDQESKDADRSVIDPPTITREERKAAVPEKKVEPGSDNLVGNVKKSSSFLTKSSRINQGLTDSKDGIITIQKNINSDKGSIEHSTQPPRSEERENKNGFDSGDGKGSARSPLSRNPPPAEQTENKSSADSARQLMAEQLNTGADSDSVVATPFPAKNRGTFKKGLEFGLLAAPDMSTVKFTNSDKAGYHIGIRLGYRLNQRWSVHTGFLYTRKNYISAGEDFHAPKGSWLDNVSLETVGGKCFMFDIPLNIRFDLNSNDNFRYFLTTGLSTYLMKKEDYHYYYQYANGMMGYRYRSYPSGDQHWLSVLNLSAGFERKLSKRLSLQAEPYLKIALSGVGYGNLKLNSYGIYIIANLKR